MVGGHFNDSPFPFVPQLIHWIAIEDTAYHLSKASSNCRTILPCPIRDRVMTVATTFGHPLDTKIGGARKDRVAEVKPPGPLPSRRVPVASPLVRGSDINSSDRFIQ
ncbi:uncharacterized protein BO66DRAFT_46225 [Aspergillus aculeatinus CBS 121060]|uniref:Uncharacterized protein n=1 Tax=Aspergillus aculeatinus CBS 121060 TaxID=1448322 RepID=A0ACD1HDT3_9EURO|nr:hypothetical protein BO66DRAFT_46225 [Aspergillus aculeatinus CBS 121060]RAH71674.1 hypothetical protein BO66DRAFT_46225 [Aspergillus aculeatinus CBS 121060]